MERVYEREEADDVATVSPEASDQAQAVHGHFVYSQAARVHACVDDHLRGGHVPTPPPNTVIRILCSNMRFKTASISKIKCNIFVGVVFIVSFGVPSCSG